ncbi:hypothetical protein HELRODRAFT_111136 [Helobdella robusta]|uniref:CCR4-NOT transcription complex subunit 4 n=1 Tax=Helobdella robusta TaxID=6412 RepID=T1EF86_HELRO|nr:hypothetical protein HELRODRAFT_111136 [Helobdella robusta]ESO05711.1 hypothetical protein HELRODRAFT_111136 [Helobdella robusta]
MTTNMQEELPECPLCMEAFEVDDLSFIPCTCGYQICRFCWHRIRTNESGLCPACRKPYPEDPAQFKPLTEDEIHNIKRDRRQKESQRKQKSAENRKHLANVRVVQKNLVFVVGLSQRLADAEVLKRHEYFGKFGKIHKVVINQSTSYIGSQGPSASAYVTYLRPEDALHAILVVNNLQVDNRTLKASLGTTKYCSHFLKGTQCTKTDCMYLHDLGDEAASFSKEDIQQGKHLQYEQKLIEQYSQNPPATESIRISNSKSKSPSPSSSDQTSPSRLTIFSPDVADLSLIHKSSSCTETPDTNTTTSPLTTTSTTATSTTASSTTSNVNAHVHNGLLDNIDYIENSNRIQLLDDLANSTTSTSTTASSIVETQVKSYTTANNNTASEAVEPTTTTTTSDEQPQQHGFLLSNVDSSSPTNENANTLDGDPNCKDDNEDEDSDDDNEDDLGFDPWDVCSKGLADMMEKEKMLQNLNIFDRTHMPAVNKMNAMNQNALTATQAIPNNYNHHNASLFNSFQTSTQQPSYAQQPHQQQQQLHWGTINGKSFYQIRHNSSGSKLIDFMSSSKSYNNDDSVLNSECAVSQDWQDNLKALLPNINISFSPSQTSAAGTLQQQQQQMRRNHVHAGGITIHPAQNGFNSYHNLLHSQDNTDWLNSGGSMLNTNQSITSDPAIISTGVVTDGMSIPRWMDQYSDLAADASCHIQHHNHLQYRQQNNHYHNYGMHTEPQSSSSWVQQHTSRYPPPGFASSRQHTEAASEHRLPAI